MCFAVKCRWPGVLALLLLLGLAGCSTPPPAPPKVEMKPVTLAEYGDTVKQFPGQIVVVTFWNEKDKQSQKAISHLVELHNKFGKDGLTVVAVNMDDHAAKREKASTLLTESKADFINLTLAEGEDEEKWFAELKVTELPTTLVFDRESKEAKRFDGLNTKELEQAVAELLKKGP